MRRDDSPPAPRPAHDRQRHGRRSEPLIGAMFRIEIDGVSEVRAVEVVFPEARIASGRGEPVVQYGPLTLRRGLTASGDWYQWWNEARRPPARNIARTVRVILLDRIQADVNRWTFLEAVPTAYSVSPLNASVSAPLIETLELAVRGFEADFDLSPQSD